MRSESEIYRKRSLRELVHEVRRTLREMEVADQIFDNFEYEGTGNLLDSYYAKLEELKQISVQDQLQLLKEKEVVKLLKSKNEVKDRAIIDLEAERDELKSQLKKVQEEKDELLKHSFFTPNDSQEFSI